MLIQATQFVGLGNYSGHKRCWVQCSYFLGSLEQVCVCFRERNPISQTITHGVNLPENKMKTILIKNFIVMTQGGGYNFMKKTP